MDVRPQVLKYSPSPHHRRLHTLRRILFVITDLDAGGAEKCCTQLAMGLDRSRWEPAVCCLTPPGSLAKPLARAGIPVHSLAVRHVWEAPRAILRLTRLARRFRPTLMHTFLFHANMIGRAAACCAGTPHVVSSIRVAEKRYRYHLFAENLTCRFSDKVVCVSHAVAKFTRLRSHVPSNRLAVIPNGIDADAVSDARQRGRSDGPAPSHAVVALYVGRMDPQKGVDVLLQALALARQRVPHLHLLLAGTGPDHDKLVALARQLGVDSQTHFLGWRDDIPTLLQAADFFVMPSRWEGMPNAVLEAMAAGLPVIATRSEGATELVRDGENGQLVAIDAPDHLAAAMVSMSGDPANRRRYGQNGQAIARLEFSLDQMLAQYERLYNSVLE